MNTEVVIETSVPLPQRKTRTVVLNPYWAALTKLNVGDSFLIPIKSSLQNTMSQVSRAKGKYCPDMKLSYATEGNQMRVWRKA